MNVIILAAGQGMRLKPLTDECPKCMVQVSGKRIIDRQIECMKAAGIEEKQIYIVTGYRDDVLKEHLAGTKITFIDNKQYETTNMVCSLMCAEDIMTEEKDVIISYGDIIYRTDVLKKVIQAQDPISVIVDDGWHGYWSQRCENPLEDAETLIVDENDKLLEIGQKTDDLTKVQSQYIGLMHFKGLGIYQMLELAREAKRRSDNGELLWCAPRTYQQMYMTDLLQGLINENKVLKAVHINRGWFEIDDKGDLMIAEEQISKEKTE